MEMFSLLAADVRCGSVTIPGPIAGVVGMIVFLIQVVVPILLIIWGMIDFAKSVIGGDEDKIKAGQKVFIRRVIAAIIVFLVITITQLTLNLVSKVGGTGNEANSAWNCAKALINAK